MTLEQRPPGQVAVADGGRVALVRDAEGALSLPEVPGWNGQAWRYRRDLAAARSAGHALPDALAAPLTHLTPLDGGGEDGAPVALAEPMEGAVRAEAWWSPGDEPPAGLSATALRALEAAFDRAPSWPPFTLPGATGMIAELAAGEPALAGRFGAHDGAMTQEQAWALSSVWRDEEVVLKLTNPAWPAEAAITSLLARLAPTHVPAVLAAGSHRGVPFLVQRRVVEPPDAYEAEPEVRLERSLGALEALAEVQLASEGHLDELVAAGVEDRRPERTADELAGLWEAVRPRLGDEQAALLPELDGRVRGTLALLARQPAVLVHGDPHLGNVLADEAGRPQLIDWTDAALAWPGVDPFVLLPRRSAGDGRREALLSAYVEALGARHEAGVRLGTEVAPTYHALSYLRIGRFLPAELAGDFLGAVTKYVERQLEFSGLVAEA